MTTSSLLVIFFVNLLKKFKVMAENRRRRLRIERQSHLGLRRCPHGRSKRWDGTLERRWHGYLKLKGIIFLTMYAQTAAMDAQQATDLLGRIMELSCAATTAAQTANTMLQNFGGGKGQGGPRFGDGAKVLRPPEVFDTDDPVKYTLWREQFLNWLTFCDNRYMDLIKDVEQLETMTSGVLEDDVKDLGVKLYSILSSYLQGPALQVVRSMQWRGMALLCGIG